MLREFKAWAAELKRSSTAGSRIFSNQIEKNGNDKNRKNPAWVCYVYLRNNKNKQSPENKCIND